jgi:G:T-mismatch repair DNA endonuclease (very short patch repair protein)
MSQISAFSATVPSMTYQSSGQKDGEICARLEERGYRIIVIRYDCNLEEQIDDHKDVFGVSK